MRDAGWQDRVDVPDRTSCARYEERTSTQLGEAAELVLDRYGGDLRRLAEEDTDRAARLLQEVSGIGPTAAVFLREVRAVWPCVRPCLDDRAFDGARRVGLPDDPRRLAGLVDGDDLARLAAGLVRITLLKGDEDPLT
jgi:hypothetical protein